MLLLRCLTQTRGLGTSGRIQDEEKVETPEPQIEILKQHKRHQQGTQSVVVSGKGKVETPELDPTPPQATENTSTRTSLGQSDEYDENSMVQQTGRVTWRGTRRANEEGDESPPSRRRISFLADVTPSEITVDHPMRLGEAILRIINW